MIELNDDILRRVIKKRRAHSHKSNYGKLLLVGGNEQFGGAIILAASAAVYAGSGLTTVACDLHNRSALHARLPEAMVIDAHSDLKAAVLAADVVVIGCGLGLSEESLKIFKEILNQITENQFLVIDGSAIGLFARYGLELPFPERTVFTPHEMELQGLSGLEIGGQNEAAAQAFANQIGAIIVAKSHQTRIFIPNQSAYLLTVGTPAQATGGMGDTLAGLIGAFIGQFSSALPKAVAAAVYLHSAIAHQLAQDAYVVLPSQIISEIPKWMKRHEES